MFGRPGHAYIYLCYGIHHLFNVVTNKEGLADAVLVRAVFPEEGTDLMLRRRGGISLQNLTNGPGKFTQALGITTSLNRSSLFSEPIWIEDTSFTIPPSDITHTRRIGIDYAEEDAHRLWRYTIDSSLLQN